MPKPLKFKERLDRMPPILCRFCAVRRHGRDVLTDQQIADASGLPMADVKRISYSVTWDAIPFGQVYRFLMGCDIDLEKRRCWRRLEYMRRHGHLRHLRKSPLFEAQFREMLDLWTGVEA